MKQKVILISIDGMRPDGFLQCGNPYVYDLMKRTTWTLDAQTVMPSVTLPCHMSMFHSVPSSKHGITSYTYNPPNDPTIGLCEVLRQAGKTSAFFYSWEPLREVTRPLTLHYSCYRRIKSVDSSDTWLTDQALAYIETDHPDFVFLYMGDTDDIGGHKYGWMSPEYLNRIKVALDNVRRVIETCGEEYSVVITADHGGHDNTHGTEMPVDMTIPMFFYGPVFPAGREIHGISILDVAPTIADVMQVPKASEWDGTSVLAK